ncbi:hypothetical protein ABW19_dt0209130 [Dactylella cylindrospora]|nr:hypothetical protein ABW19_dt0209130 [Dactylella cylindrospora]
MAEQDLDWELFGGEVPDLESEAIAPQPLFLPSLHLPTPPAAPTMDHPTVAPTPSSPSSPSESPALSSTTGPTSPSAEPSAKPKRKNKPRMNWTDEESERLLKGVEKYGVGSWSQIIQDKSFNLGHRTNTALKDRFRTLFPVEYNIHNSKDKNNEQMRPGASAENPITLELDYEHAKIMKKLNRKKCQKKEKPKEKPKRAAPVQPVTISLTTATGRRRVIRKRNTPWDPEEDADLRPAFAKFKRRWRSMAADTSMAFYGRSIDDIRARFIKIYPELLVEVANSPSPSETPEPGGTPITTQFTFEQGLVNTFDIPTQSVPGAAALPRIPTASFPFRSSPPIVTNSLSKIDAPMGQYLRNGPQDKPAASQALNPSTLIDASAKENPKKPQTGNELAPFGLTLEIPTEGPMLGRLSPPLSPSALGQFVSEEGSVPSIDSFLSANGYLSPVSGSMEPNDDIPWLSFLPQPDISTAAGPSILNHAGGPQFSSPVHSQGQTLLAPSSPVGLSTFEAHLSKPAGQEPFETTSTSNTIVLSDSPSMTSYDLLSSDPFVVPQSPGVASGA